MNERIKQLWDDAAEYTPQNTSWQSQVNFMEKFAELIVKESISVMYDNAVERNVPPDMDKTPTHYAVAILKHFGVKE